MEKLRRPPQQKAELLARCDLFSDLRQEHLLSLAGLASLRRYDRGEVLFSQQTPAAGLYVVTRGEVEVYRAGPDGSRRQLHQFGPFAVVGEVAVFAGGTYPASAAAGSPVAEALLLPRDEFLRLGGERPEILLQMLATLSGRLRHFLGRIESLATRPAPARLAARLLELAREQGSGGRPAAAARLPGSKAALARTLGMTPETLSRLLRAWRDQGLVEVGHREVQLLLPQAVADIAEG